MVRSRAAPVTLSWTMTMLAQKATVTQDTAKSDEISCPPTSPSMMLSEMESPAGRPAVKDSRYTFARKVAYSTSRIIGVISELKNIPLSLKYSLLLRLVSINIGFIGCGPP